jgi:hypothetical protein
MREWYKPHLNKLMDRLIRCHGLWIPASKSEEHYGFLRAWEYDDTGWPICEIELFPEYHECVTINNVPIFRSREDAMESPYEITAWTFLTRQGLPYGKDDY